MISATAKVTTSPMLPVSLSMCRLYKVMPILAVDHKSVIHNEMYRQIGHDNLGVL